MAKCEQCGIEYESKRSTSKYCSSLCRKLAFQKQTTKTENAKDGTLKPEDVRTLIMTPEGPKPEVPTNYGLEDCQCKQCKLQGTGRPMHIFNHGAYKDANQLADKEINRVALPGDVDYEGVAICDECLEKIGV